MVSIERTERMTKNDLVKLAFAEPEATGRIRSVEGESVVVVWNDGIVCKHEKSELRVVRLEQIAGTWMGLLTF
tara:strand:- start:76 stop:294 length:219 start_codon:yes stop_codon:yes gene_type:complete